MTLLHQSLRFGDLPIGTKFQHPRTDEIYTKISGLVTYNAVKVDSTDRPRKMLVHTNTVVTLTESIDFFSLLYADKFVYEQKVYIKIARNRAKVRDNPDITKYFEPSDSVSPL